MAELFQIYENGKGINRVFDMDAAGEAFDGNKSVNSFYWPSSRTDTVMSRLRLPVYR
ncbi:hypothetical protein HNP77_001786 [Treponema rectale]|uniref:Uncharacterized protein n=1 Tax=Treponema rectale TaxID=744512 RepID=A0A840SCB5_9SPIR|nr:hypothetical protein [Treponema rectale]MBB5219417.1 hypothetical protein [Treponema rectale]